jgi:hypothetical protein
MKRFTLISAFVLLNIGLAFSQASDFANQHPAKSVCPNIHASYAATSAHHKLSDTIEWVIERGTMPFGNKTTSRNPWLTVNWNPVSSPNGDSMPQGKITFKYQYFDTKDSVWIPISKTLDIPIYSVQHLNTNVLVNVPNAPLG